MSEDPFSPFDPLNGKPVTVVFGSFNYRRIIHEWIKRAVPLCDHWRIICLDREIISWLNEIGHGSCAVYFYDLFPEIQEYDLANLGDQRTRIIFMLRQKLFRAIAESGRDFIHSDADAFWLHDPRPWLMQHDEFDILISQGTFSPRSHFKRYRFVLCAGFFFCRANERSQNYFRQVEESKWLLDQKSMGEVIIDDPEAYWKVHRPRIWWSTTGAVRGPWHKIPVLLGSALIWMCRTAPRWSHRFKEQLLRSNFYKRLNWFKEMLDNYIYISPEIIEGSFSNRLTIGIIPMHLVTRIKCVSSTSTLIVHIRANQKKPQDT